MEARRYATSRRKACQRCSAAKAKCDLKDGGCTRCARRSLSCVYPKIRAPRHLYRSADYSEKPYSSSYALPASEGLSSSQREGSGRGTTYDCNNHININSITDSMQLIDAGSPTNTSSTIFSSLDPRNSRLDTASQLQTPPDLSGTSELICPINADDIRNRWINTYVPLPGQTRKDYPAPVTAFMSRILKSYATVAISGREAPPFVHPFQVIPGSTSAPLSTCFSLIRICERPLPGSESVAIEVLQREMTSLYEQQHGTYGGDTMGLLAAFQAYLIYCMVLFFNLEAGCSHQSFLRQAMMNLQELACSSSRQGLVCVAEQQCARPPWEAWIVAEAKRRTLFAMYLFDSILSAQDGLPTFLGTELCGLPAPASKDLWRAQTRSQWERRYNIYLADWLQGGLRIDELWPVPADLDEPGRLERRSRVDQWLGSVDEFSTMLYAVTSCTHGE